MSSTLEVIDVSQFNGTVAWPKVEADGAIIRLGYRGYGSAGTLKMDSKFKLNTTGAANAGIPYGVYWLSQATSDAEALEEAEYIIDALDGLTLTFPVYLDSEYSNTSHTGRADSLSKAARTQYALTLLNALKAAGFATGVYASESWFYGSGAMLDTAQLTEHSLWVAKYSSKTPSIGVGYDAWQYTDSGTDAGCSGSVDKSHFYKDFTSEEDDETVTYEDWKTYMEQYRAELQAKSGSSWSSDDRTWAIENGLFQGNDSGEYLWQDFLSREQAAALFHRMSGE